MFKPFFIHKHHGPGKMSNRNPRGFTAYIEPAEDPRLVVMRAALCSPKDQFCKKTGRSQAQSADSIALSKREVPNMLAALTELCDLDEQNKESWYYTLKYML